MATTTLAAAISTFFDASGNKNIGATISIGREILRLPYGGFKKKRPGVAGAVLQTALSLIN